MSARNFRAKNAKFQQMAQRSLAPMTTAIHLLIDRLLEMDVQSRVIAASEVAHRSQHVVRAPVNVVRTDENVRPV